MSNCKSIFTTGTSHWTTASSIKSISEVTLFGNAPDIKYPYFDTIILPTKWLKKFCTSSANDHVFQSFEVIF